MPLLFTLFKHFFINFCVISPFAISFLVLTTTCSAQQVEQHSQSSAIQTPGNPANPVAVLTEHQLQTSSLPDNLFTGETLNISLFMSKHNKKIDDDNFLQFISVSVIQTEPVKKRWFLHDNGLGADKEAHDGIFNISIRKTLKAGKNQFILQAKGEGFQREINHSVMVHEVELIQTRVAQTQRDNKEEPLAITKPVIEEAKESTSAWFTGIIIALIVNMIVGIGSWTGYRKWQQNRDNVYEHLAGKLE